MGRHARRRLVERADRSPRIWTYLAGCGGVLIFVAAGLSLWTGSNAEAVEAPPSDGSRGFTAQTHRALMGDTTELAQLAPTTLTVENTARNIDSPSAAIAKNPLPPLVDVEQMTEPVKPVEKEAVPTAEPAIAAVQPAEVPKHLLGERKMPEPSAPKARPVPAPAQKATRAPPTAPSAVSSSGATGLRFGLDSGARVMKTHVLREPDRFVIDLSGQDNPPALPTASGAISNIRFGKHPDHARVVIDSKRPIARATASKKGNELVVSIEYR